MIDPTCNQRLLNELNDSPHATLFDHTGWRFHACQTRTNFHIDMNNAPLATVRLRKRKLIRKYAASR